MITLQWPPGLWDAGNPRALGLDDIDAIMVRRGFEGQRAPVATVRRRLLAPELTVADLADRLASGFAAEVGDARRVRRIESEPDAAAPGLSQMLVADVVEDGVAQELRHLDGIVGTRQPDGSTVALVLSVTCTAEQLPTVGPEFTSVLGSLSSD